jgi:hypothetical protein
LTVKKVCLVISCNAFCATVEGGFIPETRYRQTERHHRGLTGASADTTNHS